jgi:hypothetical protein
MSAGVKIDQITAQKRRDLARFPRIATAGQDALGDLDIIGKYNPGPYGSPFRFAITCDIRSAP